MEVTIKELKDEAIKRMELLKLKSVAIQAFKDINTVYVSNLGGDLTITNIEQKELIEELEEDKNILIYHLIHQTTQNRDVLYCLFVDSNKENWKADKEDLVKQFAVTICCTKIKSINEIGVWVNNGQIKEIK